MYTKFRTKKLNSILPFYNIILYKIKEKILQTYFDTVNSVVLFENRSSYKIISDMLLIGNQSSLFIHRILK